MGPCVYVPPLPMQNKHQWAPKLGLLLACSLVHRKGGGANFRAVYLQGQLGQRPASGVSLWSARSLQGKVGRKNRFRWFTGTNLLSNGRNVHQSCSHCYSPQKTRPGTLHTLWKTDEESEEPQTTAWAKAEVHSGDKEVYQECTRWQGIETGQVRCTQMLPDEFRATR